VSETQAPAAAGEPGPPKPVRITIAICTYRRPALLQRTLAGIARQEFADATRPHLDVVVVDNEGDPRVGGLVEAFAAGSGIPARCVVEPSRGISHARNLALDLIAADSDFAAFIDDDEIPSPGWLQALLKTQARTGAAVVCGPVAPAFAAAPPRWIEDGGFFRQPRRPVGVCVEAADGAPVDEASTNNVLVRMAEVRRGGVRFHERFGLTGGEDVLFFRDLKAVGAEIVWSPEAMVSEHVPGERATFAYLAREYFRCGNVRAAIEAMEAEQPVGAPRSGGPASAGSVRKALKKALSQGRLLIAALVGARGRAQIYGHLFELANALGRLATCVGYRYEHYR
jgi:glycosyltransferase involved in cell wall biosynthesis